MRELARHGVAARAAREASPGSITGALQTFKDERRRDAAFDDAWNEAVESAHADLLHELIRRAKDGTDETVYGPSGQPIGNRKKYSDRLLLEAVRARFPDFTPRSEINQVTAKGPDLSCLEKLSTESRRQLRQILDRELERSSADRTRGERGS